LAGIFFLTAVVLTVSIFIKNQQSISKQAAAATTLSISPSSQSLHTGHTADFSVVMNTGTNQVTGIDLILNFNPSVLQVNSITRGNGLGGLNNEITKNIDNAAGTVSYVVFTLDRNQAITGSALEVLKVNAEVKSNASIGTSSITFDGSTAISAINETQSALTSTVPGNINIESSPTASPVPTNSPSPSPAPTAEPNYCGGTCGSNTNCQSGLFCYQGYCRNPSCSTNVSCVCTNPTNQPTQRPSMSPTPRNSSSPVPTPEVITYKEDNSSNDPTPNNFWEDRGSNESQEELEESSPVVEPLSESTADNFLPWIIGSLIAAGVTLVTIIILVLKDKGFFHRNRPPIIKI
jgi:hypothetical protein